MWGPQTQGAPHLLSTVTVLAHCTELVWSCHWQSESYKHAVSLGSLWQPILKRCLQRMERGKSRSDLAWRPAGLANQFLYVPRCKSSVGQVPGQISRFSQTMPCCPPLRATLDLAVLPALAQSNQLSQEKLIYSNLQT